MPSERPLTANRTFRFCVQIILPMSTRPSSSPDSKCLLIVFPSSSALAVSGRRFSRKHGRPHDIVAAKDFERNFAGTYIGEHKTALVNTFRLIHFDFSGIPADKFVQGFIEKNRRGLTSFCMRYGFSRGLKAIDKEFDDPNILLSAFLRTYKKTYKESVYLIIDEYDQGAKEVLATHLDSFQGLTRPAECSRPFTRV